MAECNINTRTKLSQLHSNTIIIVKNKLKDSKSLTKCYLCEIYPVFVSVTLEVKSTFVPSDVGV